MATLKEYIEQVALRLGSAGSRSKAGYIEIKTDFSGFTDYTPPSDGTLSVAGMWGSGTWQGFSVRRAADLLDGMGLSCGYGSWLLASAPCKKGVPVRIQVENGVALSFIRFIPSVGGA